MPFVGLEALFGGGLCP